MATLEAIDPHFDTLLDMDLDSLFNLADIPDSFWLKETILPLRANSLTTVDINDADADDEYMYPRANSLPTADIDDADDADDDADADADVKYMDPQALRNIDPQALIDIDPRILDAFADSFVELPPTPPITYSKPQSSSKPKPSSKAKPSAKSKMTAEEMYENTLRELLKILKGEFIDLGIQGMDTNFGAELIKSIMKHGINFTICKTITELIMLGRNETDEKSSKRKLRLGCLLVCALSPILRLFYSIFCNYLNGGGSIAFYGLDIEDTFTGVDQYELPIVVTAAGGNLVTLFARLIMDIINNKDFTRLTKTNKILIKALSRIINRAQTSYVATPQKICSAIIAHFKNNRGAMSRVSAMSRVKTISKHNASDYDYKLSPNIIDMLREFHLQPEFLDSIISELSRAEYTRSKRPREPDDEPDDEADDEPDDEADKILYDEVKYLCFDSDIDCREEIKTILRQFNIYNSTNEPINNLISAIQFLLLRAKAYVNSGKTLTSEQREEQNIFMKKIERDRLGACYSFVYTDSTVNPTLNRAVLETLYPQRMKQMYYDYLDDVDKQASIDEVDHKKKREKRRNCLLYLASLIRKKQANDLSTQRTIAYVADFYNQKYRNMSDTEAHIRHTFTYAKLANKYIAEFFVSERQQPSDADIRDCFRSIDKIIFARDGLILKLSAFIIQRILIDPSAKAREILEHIRYNYSIQTRRLCSLVPVKISGHYTDETHQESLELVATEFNIMRDQFPPGSRIVIFALKELEPATQALATQTPAHQTLETLGEGIMRKTRAKKTRAKKTRAKRRSNKHTTTKREQNNKSKKVRKQKDRIKKTTLKQK